MSVKRQATSELNHENWDQDDPSDKEEMGTFKTAAKDVLEKRVIRTAKRRTTTSGDEPKKSVFSGFGGFNKPPPSSFDFLANLTNGAKNTNGSALQKLDSTLSETETASQVESKSSDSIFKSPVTTSPAKSTFGISSSTSTSIFGGSLNKPSQSPTSVSKFHSTAESMNEPHDSTAKTTNLNTNSNPNSGKVDGAEEEITDEKKLTYYSKLKTLNESVSDWIKKHVEETPLCILTPIFKDYEKYLKDIQDDYHGTKIEAKLDSQSNSEIKTPFTNSNVGSSPIFGSIKNNTASSENSGGFSFGIKTDNKLTNSNQVSSANFSFGINTSTNSENKTCTSISPSKPVTGGEFTLKNSAPVSTSGFGSKIDDPISSSNKGGFSFGITSTLGTSPTSGSSVFSNINSTTSSNVSPFSFGTGTPFSFSPNVQKPTEPTSEENNEDEPPKVEYTPIKEENCVFDSKCKIFVKKDGNFADKGVGTLYIKKIEESGKHQLLVRANTSLGNILLNIILSSSIPTQRLGKNNVMIVCIPTPDTKPPPTPVLIRVKTSDEADALLETLNKYKV